MKKSYKLFYIFIITSICGYFIEFIWTLLTKGIIINHSAVVIGPFNFAYGICGVVFTLLLDRFKDESYLKVFLLSFIGGSILEYIMSWGMELVLGFTAWDYSDKFLNINGRICFAFSLFWGLLGILWIKILYPMIEEWLNKVNPKTSKTIVICLTIFLVFDILLTISSVNRAHRFDRGIQPKGRYERFLDNTFNSKYLKNMFNNNWSEV